MTFLDKQVARQDDPKMVELHSVVVQAYDDLYEALSIAGQAGLVKTEIGIHPKLWLTWWSILEEAARQGRLRRLVAKALKDPTISGWHDIIRKLLDIPEEALVAEIDAKPATRASLWPIGHTLKVRFLDGKPTLHRLVERAAQQWVDYANLKLDFGDHPDAEIRISFERSGTWSKVGMDSLSVPDPDSNVNFGWLKPSTPKWEIQRVVLHEFGHVLGLLHEHGNPASDLKWNKAAVYRAMAGPPNNWSRQVIDQEILGIWAPGHFPIHKVFDPASIMIFPLPGQYFRDKKQIDWNLELSSLDKQFVAALYPQRER